MSLLSSKSTRLVFKCPRCNKRVEVVKEISFGTSKLVDLTCGHTIGREQLGSENVNVDEKDWTLFDDGRRLFPFQKITLENILKANGRCLLALDMGLGKTLCGIAATRQCFEQMKDILVVTKSGLILQWFEEYLKSSGVSFAPIIIENSNQKPLKGYPIHIVSYDLLRRMNMDDFAHFNTIILDECQHIKNPTSQRTKNVRLICNNAKYIIATSGTPFKNNIDEYFTILNILRPDKHGNYANFVRRWCNVVKKGMSYKIEGLQDPERFLAYNSDFVFRFEREDVLPDLPKIFRQYRYNDVDEDVQNAYDKLNGQFQAFYEKVGGNLSLNDYTNILAFFAKMRHLAGLAKINPTIEYVEEFLTQTERKLTIFVHHKDVNAIMLTKLEALCKERGISPPLNLVAELNMDERGEVIRKFRDTDSRIMIASTLASGEGLNLQFCSDCVMMERQWNPANEEQAEARFPRPGSIAKSVSATYMVAIGTIDEYLAEIIEKKRQIVKEGLDGSSDVKWDESSIIRDLAETLAMKGKKRWGRK